MSDSFRHILVTLDGSSLSEVAVPVAIELARTSHAQLTLLHVVEPDAPATVHGDRHLQSAAEATDYLADWVDRLAQDGIAATSIVAVAGERGRVAETIAARVSALGCDLIVLASHGEGGIRELLFGRVAQRIIGLSDGPLIVVPATEEARPFDLRILALPLDGSPEAEIVLPLASSLAENSGARIILIRVVPTPGDLQGSGAAVRTFLPSATARVLTFEVEDANDYLREIASTWFPNGAVTIDVRRGAVDSEIKKALVHYDADLLFMGTHGRGGLTALLEGSLGAQLLSAARCPILLMRFPDKPS